MVSRQQVLLAIDSLEGVVKFLPASEVARFRIASEIMGMVNWPEDRPVKNKLGDVLSIRYVHPVGRLNWLFDTISSNVKEWPGMREIRALYCKKFTPADGIEGYNCSIAGYTDEECEAGVDTISIEGRDNLESVPALPAPEDQPIGDLVFQITEATKSKRGQSE